MSDKPLTSPQRRVLEILAEGPENGMSPRDVARILWPDSPAWEHRTWHRGTNHNGALGGTMPMNAAKILWRLWPTYVNRSLDWTGSDNGLWEITDKGRRALAGDES